MQDSGRCLVLSERLDVVKGLSFETLLHRNDPCKLEKPTPKEQSLPCDLP